MREDMAKVLVERPRHGGGYPYPRGNGDAWRRVPIEDHPRKEPITFAWRHVRKELNENLAPLRRFLRSRLGRPWDDVYGEICERIDRGSAVQFHIWQHLMWEVEQDPVKVARLFDERYVAWGSQFYVDPRSRRLCESVCTRRFRRTPRAPFLVERGGRAFKQVGGIWYEIETAALAPFVDRVWDAVLSRSDAHPYGHVDRATILRTYGKPIYAVRKRQLNTKEIRALGTTP